MEIEKTKEIVKGVFGMQYSQAKLLDEFIKSHDLSDLLELGFANGVSSCYFASILKDMGKGHLVTIDNETAKTREPNIKELLEKTGLEDFVSYYFERSSYNWRLMKLIEENDGPIFDFCYVDGAHDWYNDGFAFFLVDKLLKPGGWILFDDYDWSFGTSPSMKNLPRVLAMTEEERDTPQIKKVFDVLVKDNPKYHNCKLMHKNQWAIAQKKSEEDLNNDIDFLKNELALKEAEIKDLKNKNKKLRKTQKEILSSNSWKITKPLRKIRNKK